MAEANLGGFPTTALELERLHLNGADRRLDGLAASRDDTAELEVARSLGPKRELPTRLARRARRVVPASADLVERAPVRELATRDNLDVGVLNVAIGVGRLHVHVPVLRTSTFGVRRHQVRDGGDRDRRRPIAVTVLRNRAPIGALRRRRRDRTGVRLLAGRRGLDRVVAVVAVHGVVVTDHHDTTDDVDLDAGHDLGTPDLVDLAILPLTLRDPRRSNVHEVLLLVGADLADRTNLGLALLERPARNEVPAVALHEGLELLTRPVLHLVRRGLLDGDHGEVGGRPVRVLDFHGRRAHDHLRDLGLAGLSDLLGRLADTHRQDVLPAVGVLAVVRVDRGAGAERVRAEGVTLGRNHVHDTIARDERVEALIRLHDVVTAKPLRHAGDHRLAAAVVVSDGARLRAEAGTAVGRGQCGEAHHRHHGGDEDGDDDARAHAPHLLSISWGGRIPRPLLEPKLQGRGPVYY